MNKPDNSLIVEEKEPLQQLKNLLEEKKLEIKQLKQENNLLRQMFDRLPGHIFCKDIRGVYLLSNVHDRKMNSDYGTENAKHLEDFSGKTDEEIFPAHLAKIFRDADIEVIRTGKSLVIERKRFNEDGQPIIETVNKIPLYDTQGEIMAVLGYCFDITYLKSLEAKVKNNGKSKIEFIRHVQHDIKTPFIGITGLADLLLDRETDSEKKDFLKDIILCANELMEYCERILDFAKATVKNLPLVPLAFQLRDLVDGVINIATPGAKNKQLHLLLDYAKALPEIVIGYPHRLKSILVNLLNNALQYTQQGKIHLIVQPKAIANNSPLIIQFIIKDTGQGMSLEKRIATEEQLNNAPTLENDTYEGRGLGLRIVSQFSKDINAKISVISELGVGTTFTVEVPLEINQA